CRASVEPSQRNHPGRALDRRRADPRSRRGTVARVPIHRLRAAQSDHLAVRRLSGVLANSAGYLRGSAERVRGSQVLTPSFGHPSPADRPAATIAPGGSAGEGPGVRTEYQTQEVTPPIRLA